MQKSAIQSAFPYVIGLAVAALLFYFAQQIQYTPRPGMLGPAFWPKLAIGMMAAVCLFEIGRIIAGFKSEMQGIAEALEKDDGEQTTAYPRLLIGGIVLVLVYAAVVDVLGFLLSTFLFLAAFMYLGRYWKHVVVWSVSAGVTVLAALIFIRLAYISLPRGIPPFDRVTDIVRFILGG
jgi:hypothetical protein